MELSGRSSVSETTGSAQESCEVSELEVRGDTVRYWKFRALNSENLQRPPPPLTLQEPHVCHQSGVVLVDPPPHFHLICTSLQLSPSITCFTRTPPDSHHLPDSCPLQAAHLVSNSI